MVQEDKVFKNPRNIFQQRINETIYNSPTKNLIEDLIKLTIFKSAEKDEKMLKLAELYNLVGLEVFCQIIDLFSDQVIKFPSKESLKESVQVALCYYYKNYKNLTWDEIKDTLEDQELSAVKLGIKINQLEKFMGNITEIIEKRKSKK